MLRSPGTKATTIYLPHKQKTNKKGKCSFGCSSNLWKAHFACSQRLQSTHKNTSFVHNLYQAIISIFMHKRFLPRRLYHNPLERHRRFSLSLSFSFHCAYIVAAAAMLNCRFGNLRIFFGLFLLLESASENPVLKQSTSKSYRLYVRAYILHDPMLHIAYEKNCMYVTFFPYRQEDGATSEKKQPIKLNSNRIYGMPEERFLWLSCNFSMMVLVSIQCVIGNVVHEHFVVSDYFIYFE